jgi:hypothetical protein
MADAKTHVEIPEFALKDIFDSKHKSRVIDLVSKTAEAAVKRSAKPTLDAPKGKDNSGWSANGSVVSLEPDKSGKKLEALVSIAVATWPGKSIKPMVKGSAAIAIDNPTKTSPGDVDAVAEGAAETTMKTAMKYMESNKPV